MRTIESLSELECGCSLTLVEIYTGNCVECIFDVCSVINGEHEFFISTSLVICVTDSLFGGSSYNGGLIEFYSDANYALSFSISRDCCVMS